MNEEGKKQRVPAEALNQSRKMCGGDCLMVAGTAASIGRGFSSVTQMRIGEEEIVCPPVLTCCIIPRGQAVETAFQGASRASCKLRYTVELGQ